jgi:small GTP-binding protein
MIDITSNNSFNSVKNLIKKIETIINKDNNNPNYDNGIYKNNFKKLLVLNKFDLESEKKVSQEEISFFMNNNTSIESIEISLKTLQGAKKFNDKLFELLKVKNDSKISSDYIYEDVNSYNNPQMGLTIKAIGTINCILIGDTEVGKSSFFLRYFKNEFSDSFLTTVGIDKETKIVKIKSDVYRMTLWDTAGQERFRSLPLKYFQNADGVFLLFDLNNPESFNNINAWVNDIKRNTRKSIRRNLFLIGNKIDLERKVTKEEAIKVANEHGMKYFEISCKINMNVCEVVNRMINLCYSTIENKIVGGKLNKSKDKNKTGGGGCCSK